MKSDKQQVKDLWQTCFDDDEAFAAFYFDRVYRPENTVIYKEEGIVLSALQLLPYTMTYAGAEIPVSYISGASTAPGARGRGLMKGVLADAFERMRRRGDYLSVLIPAEEWLFGFYRKTGYAEAMYCRMCDCMPAPVDTPAGAVRRVTGLREDGPAFDACCRRLYGYFSKKMKERPCCVQHTPADFRNILTDLALSRGDVFLASPAGEEVAGLAFVYPSPGGAWLVKECLADTGEVKDGLLSGIAAYYAGSEVRQREFVSTSGLPYGMARVIDAEAMLRIYAQHHPACTLTLSLFDDLLPGNTGVYRIGNGACRKSEQPVAEALPLTMPELTRWLFTGCCTYMTLMLD
ncbi:MAG: GNAT family N-acetyltransferase [Parabacteroides sp.]|nr:GNAT family N-acetyltransferase [Parabacteroides sp.]